MDLNQLEKIKEHTKGIELIILNVVKNHVVDETADYLQLKLKGFSDALDFSIKEELYKDYQSKQQTQTKE